MTHPDLERLTAEIMAAPKYRAISPDLIRSVAARELAIRKSYKDALKEAKTRLHQVAAVYQEARPDYAAWLADLRAAAGETAALAARERLLLSRHASTRERLPILTAFYAATLGDLPPIRSVLDLACGLNPLAWRAMPLAAQPRYDCCDLFDDMAAFLNSCFVIAGLDGRAEVRDLLGGPPPIVADVALLLKTWPVLEQLEKGAALRLLRAIDAPTVIVSFPLQSLGGRGRGMGAFYEQQFRAAVVREPWQIEMFSFTSELAFRVRK